MPIVFAHVDGGLIDCVKSAQTWGERTPINIKGYFGLGSLRGGQRFLGRVCVLLAPNLC